MNNPTKVKIENRVYPIATDFRVALECNKIGLDTTIGDYERALAVIYKLFGEKGLKARQDHEKLLELAKKYLACGKEEINSNNENIDMDFEQDYDFIIASFMSDYNIDLETKNMHWWQFVNLLNGLSNSELGSCCILNRIRNLRNYDTSKIKDLKLKSEIEEAKKKVAIVKRKKYTDKQIKSMEKYRKLTGIEN